jgi:hypothetical protein
VIDGYEVQLAGRPCCGDGCGSCDSEKHGGGDWSCLLIFTLRAITMQLQSLITDMLPMLYDVGGVIRTVCAVHWTILESELLQANQCDLFSSRRASRVYRVVGPGVSLRARICTYPQATCSKDSIFGDNDSEAYEKSRDKSMNSIVCTLS